MFGEPRLFASNPATRRADSWGMHLPELPRHVRLSSAIALLASCSLQGFEGDLTEPSPDAGHSGAAGRRSGGSAVSGSGGSGGNPLQRPSTGAGMGGRAPLAGSAGMSASSGGQAGARLDEGTGAVASTSGTMPTSGRGGSANGGASGASAGTMTDAGEGSSAAGASAAGAAGQPDYEPPPLFFSEYVEGTSNNKAVEISTTAPGTLEGCVVQTYTNGEARQPLRTVTLSGPIEPLRPLVVCEKSFAEPSRCDVSSALSFNGDDFVALRCRAELLDSIGRLGERPEQKYWGTPELGTLDKTLRRNCDIHAGDRDATDPYDPSLEWSAAEVDDFADLGTHCEPPEP